MSKATYWQRGETLDYVNTTASIIEANTIVKIGSTRIGVAGTSIAPNEKGTLHVVGVFEMDKTAAEAIAIGTPVYFTGTAITATATSNTPAGYAVQTADAASAKVLVKLLG